tara:strand:+ start:236 stop:355 length:120 start_codon:yes stop_codon:yes gene_type:complete
MEKLNTENTYIASYRFTVFSTHKKKAPEGACEFVEAEKL